MALKMFSGRPMFTESGTFPILQEVLLYGAVLSGMKPTDPPVEGPKNDPMMPVAWVKTYEWDNGNTNRIFNTTMGASVDLECDLRRLLVNACLWCLEMADEIPEAANVDYVGEYKPTFYGFTNRDFGRKRISGLRISIGLKSNALVP